MSDGDRPPARPPLAALSGQALMERQQALIARSAVLRERMAHDAAPLAASLERADRLLDTLRWLRAHAGVPALGAAAVALWRPRKAWRWAARAWKLWRGWQRLRRLLKG